MVKLIYKQTDWPFEASRDFVVPMRIGTPRNDGATFVVVRHSLLFLFLLYSISYILFPSPTLAAELFFEANPPKPTVTQEFEVQALINTPDEHLNAFSGTIPLPNEIVSLKEIRDGNSIINLWVDRPSAQTNGSIIFSGITPGGFQGNHGKLFSFILEAKQAGPLTITTVEAQGLRNDGVGSKAELTVKPLDLQILKESKITIPINLEIMDHEPPEAFTLELGRDPTILDNAWFVVFATQDKGSGIDHYEIRETTRKFEPNEMNAEPSAWSRAESPYVLTDQSLASYVYVKAVDKKGNQRVATLAAHPVPWYTKYQIWIILLGIIFVLLLGGKLWRRKK